MGRCTLCQCTNFQAHAWKSGVCNFCFHARDDHEADEPRADSSVMPSLPAGKPSPKPPATQKVRPKPPPSTSPMPVADIVQTYKKPRPPQTRAPPMRDPPSRLPPREDTLPEPLAPPPPLPTGDVSLTTSGEGDLAAHTTTTTVTSATTVTTPEKEKDVTPSSPLSPPPPPPPFVEEDTLPLSPPPFPPPPLPGEGTPEPAKRATISIAPFGGAKEVPPWKKDLALRKSLPEGTGKVISTITTTMTQPIATGPAEAPLGERKISKGHKPPFEPVVSDIPPMPSVPPPPPPISPPSVPPPPPVLPRTLSGLDGPSTPTTQPELSDEQPQPPSSPLPAGPPPVRPLPSSLPPLVSFAGTSPQPSFLPSTPPPVPMSSPNLHSEESELSSSTPRPQPPARLRPDVAKKIQEGRGDVPVPVVPPPGITRLPEPRKARPPPTQPPISEDEALTVCPPMPPTPSVVEGKKPERTRATSEWTMERLVQTIGRAKIGGLMFAEQQVEDPRETFRTCFYRILEHMLLAAGMQEDQVKEITSVIQSLLSRSPQTSFMVNEDTARNLQLALLECHTILEEQKRVQAATTIQRMARGFLQRQLFPNLRSPTTRKRAEIYREVLRSERAFIKNLERIVLGYHLPLQDPRTTKSMISPSDVKVIFANVADLLSVSRQLYVELERLMKNWPLITGVGSVFLEMAPHLKSYGEYVNNFKHAMDTLTRCRENPRFVQYLENIEATLQSGGDVGMDIFTLLSLPLNQISKYELHLENLSNFTLSTHPDYDPLINATSMMKKVAEYVSQSLQRAEMKAQILEIQRRLSGFEGELYNKERAFLREGHLLIKDPKQKGPTERVFFVFNDIVLKCKPSSKGNMKYQETLDLNNGQVVDARDDLTSRYVFDLNSSTTQLRIVCKSPDEKRQWMRIFEELIEARHKNKIFRVSLSVVLERGGSANGVPTFVNKAFTYILREAIDCEGIFRISGDQAEITRLRRLLNEGEDVNLEGKDVHVVAGTLKLWYRELPEPVCTFAKYNEFVHAQETEDDEQRLTLFRQIISEIPWDYQFLLKYTISRLRQVARNCTVNKMTASNVAIVFGPNLLRPAEETIETTLNIPFVNVVIQTMIDQFDRLWGADVV